VPLPPYVRRLVESVDPQPYLVKGCHIICFALAADRKKLQAVVDQYFNQPSGGAVDYRALSDYVLASSFHIPDSRSTGSEETALNAFYEEMDLLFFIPVAYGKTHDGVFRAERVVWFVPAVFVDTSAAVAEGREVYGFPKLLARCIAPKKADDPAFFSVTTDIYQGDAKGRRLQPAEIFRAKRHDSDKLGDQHATWGAWFDAISGMRDLLKVHSEQKRFGDGLREKVHLFSSDQRLLVLKQFRDAADATRACLLQIVECPITVTGFRGAGLVAGDWTVSIARFPKFTLASDLGIVGDGAPVKPIAVYWVKLDCRLENGIVVWSA
jgi:hypothetical protein